MLPLDLSAGYPAELMSYLTSPVPRSMPKYPRVGVTSEMRVMRAKSKLMAVVL